MALSSTVLHCCQTNTCTQTCGINNNSVIHWNQFQQISNPTVLIMYNSNVRIRSELTIRQSCIIFTPCQRRHPAGTLSSHYMSCDVTPPTPTQVSGGHVTCLSSVYSYCPPTLHHNIALTQVFHNALYKARFNYSLPSLNGSIVCHADQCHKRQIVIILAAF